MRQGEIPKELAAYVEFARAAGNVEHADRIEGLAQAVSALSRDEGNTRESPPLDPKKASIDPARLAEAREFAKVIQAAQNADAAKEKRGIDTARLAEARVFARALKEVRVVEKNLLYKGLDFDS